jgi:hypothetical protein
MAANTTGRRGILAAGAAVLAAPVAGGAPFPTGSADAGPTLPAALAARLARPETGACICMREADTRLVRAGAAYIEATKAYDRDGGRLECKDDPLWWAVESAEAALTELSPQTWADVRALAEVARYKAIMPDGSMDWSESFTGDFPAMVCQAVLRLTATR